MISSKRLPWEHPRSSRSGKRCTRRGAEFLFRLEIADFDFDLMAALGGHPDFDGLIKGPIDGRLLGSANDRSGTFAFHHEIAIANSNAAADELPGDVGCGKEILPREGSAAVAVTGSR